MFNFQFSRHGKFVQNPTMQGDITKAQIRVRAHAARTKTGKVVQVKEHGRMVAHVPRDKEEQMVQHHQDTNQHAYGFQEAGEKTRARDWHHVDTKNYKEQQNHLSNLHDTLVARHNHLAEIVGSKERIKSQNLKKNDEKDEGVKASSEPRIRDELHQQHGHHQSHHSAIHDSDETNATIDYGKYDVEKLKNKMKAIKEFANQTAEHHKEIQKVLDKVKKEKPLTDDQLKAAEEKRRRRWR